MSFNLSEQKAMILVDQMITKSLRYYKRYGITREELTNAGICAILGIYTDNSGITQKELEMETLRTLRRFIYSSAEYQKRKRDMNEDFDPTDVYTDSTPGPEEDFIQNDLINRMLSKLDCLDIRSKYILSQCFLVKNPRTLDDIGLDLGLSKQRVAVIKGAALNRLKEELNND